ncbi:DUF6411 family protein [Streptomyces sp. NEAU-YJ-81]|uniref:DUF6411 family protein n=1 Tax=Streptomyces sp. NEAU-YJ-81 TaxID=2820288 RepID=UPI0035AD8FC4
MRILSKPFRSSSMAVGHSGSISRRARSRMMAQDMIAPHGGSRARSCSGTSAPPRRGWGHGTDFCACRRLRAGRGRGAARGRQSGHDR